MQEGRQPIRTDAGFFGSSAERHAEAGLNLSFGDGPRGPYDLGLTQLVATGCADELAAPVRSLRGRPRWCVGSQTDPAPQDVLPNGPNWRSCAHITPYSLQFTMFPGHATVGLGGGRCSAAGLPLWRQIQVF